MDKNIIPEETVESWQSILNIIARLLNTKAALLTEVNKPYIKVLQANDSEDNPLTSDSVYKLTGLYCEEVIKKEEKVYIRNAIKDDKWNQAPEIDYNLISYLGYPVFRPDRSILGTICVMDDKERVFNDEEIELLYHFKKVIENSLEKIELNKKLAEARFLLQASLNSLSSSIVVLDSEGYFKFSNKVFKDFLKENDFVISNIKELVGVISKNAKNNSFSLKYDELMSGISRVIAGHQEVFSLEYQCFLQKDNKNWFKMKVTPFSGTLPYAAVLVIEDITERKEKEEKMEYYSYHDLLTGLYNRRYFAEKIETLNKSSQMPISIIIGDIDGLKQINDNYGHKRGDQFIKEAASVFQSAIRAEDIVARIGGDEFAVLLPDTDQKDARKICQRIKEKSQLVNKEQDIPELLKISLGCATKKDQETDLNQIFNQADQQMYENKGSRIKVYLER